MYRIFNGCVSDWLVSIVASLIGKIGVSVVLAMRFAMWLAIFLPTVVLAASTRGIHHDDVQSSTADEAQWFYADQHLPEIRQFMAQAARTCTRSISLLDLFGASERMSRAWQSHGLLTASYDIKNDQQDDITTRGGFFRLAERGLLLVAGALIFAAPPCSRLAYDIGCIWLLYAFIILYILLYITIYYNILHNSVRVPYIDPLGDT